MTEIEASGFGEHPPPYMIFLVVFLFFLTGLLGFLICHLLKKKGYRCRTGDMDDEEHEEKIGNADNEDEENQDTVERILKCIIENEANMEAFNEMLGNHNICVRHDPRLRKESISGVPPHHHTVHSSGDHNSCHLCAQVRSKKGRRQSRAPRSKQRPGEQTVFSVGRFRVTHTDKKLHGSPNPLVSSGDQLDQSQDSEEKKEGGYNLRSMFKDVRPSLESSNGVATNVGKRRKSVTIFGLRRGSDPVGIKAVEGTGRETGGVKFSIYQQSVVVEELVQAENRELPNTKPGSKPETKPLKDKIPAPLQHDAKTAGFLSFSSSKNKKHDSSPAPEYGSTPRPSPEPHTALTIQPSVGSTATPAPSSLLIPSATLSRQMSTKMEKQEHLKDEVLLDAYDPGPLQTSTPIVPMPGSIPALIPVIPAGQPPSCTVIQTPPDPSSSLDQETGFGANLALISLGSSPLSSFPMQTQSSASSLKTSPSPQQAMPSLRGNIPSEAVLSHGFPPSPQLPSGIASQSPILSKTACPLQTQTPSPVLNDSPKLDTKPQSPTSPADQNPFLGSSPHLTLKSGMMSVTSMTQRDVVSSPLSPKEQELEAARLRKTEKETEIKRVGFFKTAKLSPVEGGFKGSALSSSSDHLSKDRLSSLLLSPSSSLSPSSPVGSRVSNVTIVKASPDSKREFSVVTMVDDEGALVTDQELQKCELWVESEKAEVSPTVGQGGEGTGQPQYQRGKIAAAETMSMLGQQRDDMVEMEDIRDCKVTKKE